MNTNSADVPATGHDAQANNRRGEERVSARFEVHFNHAQEAARALRAYSLNISAGGLCLRTRRAYDVGMTEEDRTRLQRVIDSLPR